MPAFLLVPDRSRVRLDACPSAKLGAVFDPGLRQWPGMAGAPTRSPGHPLFEKRQQDHLGSRCRGGPPALRQLHPHRLFLDRLARMVNPLLPDLQKFGSYWGGIDQCEYATDLLFKERGVLETVRDDLVAMTGFGAVLRFLDRKPHPAFTGEVTIDRKTRPEGCRVKFRLKANAIKLYDHQNVLRIDINNPREFKVLRVIERNGDKQPRWCPMGKSVEHFWRYAQVAEGANRRLIDALATAPLTGAATQELDELCRGRDGTRVARFNPIDAQTVLLFIAVLCSPSPGSAIATSRPGCPTPRPRMTGRPDAEPTRPRV